MTRAHKCNIVFSFLTTQENTRKIRICLRLGFLFDGKSIFYVRFFLHFILFYFDAIMDDFKIQLNLRLYSIAAKQESPQGAL